MENWNDRNVQSNPPNNSQVSASSYTSDSFEHDPKIRLSPASAVTVRNSCGILWHPVASCGMWSYIGKSAIFLGGCCSGAAAATFLRAEERRRQVKAGEYYQLKGRESLAHAHGPDSWDCSWVRKLQNIMVNWVSTCYSTLQVGI